MSDLFRVYFDPAEIGPDGYPYAWHGRLRSGELLISSDGLCDPDAAPIEIGPAIKDLVREQAGHRCVRCGHPYRKGEHKMEQVTLPNGVVRNELWSPCDEFCRHHGPTRQVTSIGILTTEGDPRTAGSMAVASATEPGFGRIEALWRILTVHHLNGIKHDCRWWNLASLCQRCHLTIQAKVFMERPWDREHSEWFKPYAAGFYAWKYLGEELTREETMARLDELLAIEQIQEALF